MRMKQINSDPTTLDPEIKLNTLQNIAVAAPTTRVIECKSMYKLVCWTFLQREQFWVLKHDNVNLWQWWMCPLRPPAERSFSSTSLPRCCRSPPPSGGFGPPPLRPQPAVVSPAPPQPRPLEAWAWGAGLSTDPPAGTSTRVCWRVTDQHI